MGQPEIMTALERDARYQAFWSIDRALGRTHEGNAIGLRTYCTLVSAALFLNDGDRPFDTLQLEDDPSNDDIGLHVRYHVGELLHLLDGAHPEILEARGWPRPSEIHDLAMETVNSVYSAVETFLEVRRPNLQAQGYI
jgi:hypothetical protein